LLHTVNFNLLRIINNSPELSQTDRSVNFITHNSTMKIQSRRWHLPRVGPEFNPDFWRIQYLRESGWLGPRHGEAIQVFSSSKTMVSLRI